MIFPTGIFIFIIIIEVRKKEHLKMKQKKTSETKAVKEREGYFLEVVAVFGDESWCWNASGSNDVLQGSDTEEECFRA